ncbi:DNA topoisomerase 2 [Hordeum vulgare]|nr:DNA topoisomerase 2 [Hordeum vulgare]
MSLLFCAQPASSAGDSSVAIVLLTVTVLLRAFRVGAAVSERRGWFLSGDCPTILIQAIPNDVILDLGSQECRTLAIRRGDTDIDLALHNIEAIEDLSETQRELVDMCFYSRGVTLDYHQMYVISRQIFDDNYILYTPFVHRMDSTKVISQHMVIPSMVVRSLKEFVSIPRTGSLTLEITLDYEDDDISVSIPCSYFIGLGGRMVLKKEGFDNFLLASSTEVNTLVFITFKEREHELAVVFSNLP